MNRLAFLCGVTRISHQTNVFEIAQPCKWFEIFTQFSPMMRFSRVVSTTSLVTTWNWFVTKICSTCM
jgi:hypothetical protein